MPSGHYLSQCWPRSMSPNGITRPQRVNIGAKDGNIYAWGVCVCIHIILPFWQWNLPSCTHLIMVILCKAELHTVWCHYNMVDFLTNHDDVMKWKHFPHYWPFVWGIHRSPVSSPHKGQWHGALIFSLICVWINGWVNNREAGDLRCAHYDVSVMSSQ